MNLTANLNYLSLPFTSLFKRCLCSFTQPSYKYPVYDVTADQPVLTTLWKRQNPIVVLSAGDKGEVSIMEH